MFVTPDELEIRVRARLASVPWDALRGLAPELDAPLREVLGGRPAERVIDRFLRSHRAFTDEQRTACVEALFGLGLWRRRLEWEVSSTHPRAMLFALLHRLGGVPSGAASAFLELAAPPALASGPPPDLSIRFSLPDWIARTLGQEVGEEAESLAAAFCLPGPICFRTNLLKTSRERLLAQLASEGVSCEPTLHAAAGIRVHGRPNILGLPSQQQGLFEVQDEGSQLLAELVDARPGETVLDLCAGAGGKTLALAAAMQNRGALYAHDIDASRLDRLLQRCTRAGVNCVRLLRPDELPEALLADRVLVDAPCSELGALRRGPDLRFRLDPSNFDALPPLQHQLLARALRHLKPGGRLVYATCTLRRQENEDVCLAFEQANPALRRLPVLPEFDHRGFFRALPHRHGTDGFFAAAWRNEVR